MDVAENLQRFVPAGEIVRPWLLLGPFHEDVAARVPGVSVFERPDVVAGRQVMSEAASEAIRVLGEVPLEADQGTFRGQDARWALVRRPEEYLSWGVYEWGNHLTSVFLSSRVSTDRPGPCRWQLVTRISCRVMVALNGHLVYDTDEHPTAALPPGPTTPATGVYEYHFCAAMEPGENVLNVGLFRLARMAQVGLRLECVDSDLTARVAIPEGMTLEERHRVEEEVGGLRLDTDVYYPEQPLRFRLERKPSGPVHLTLTRMVKMAHLVVPQVATEPPLQWQLDADREPLTDGRAEMKAAATARGIAGASAREADDRGVATVGPEGLVTLCRGDQIADGLYRLEAAWEVVNGVPLTGVTFDIHKLSPEPWLPGDEHIEKRRHIVLERYGSSRESRQIWSEAALYALGRHDEVDEGVIREVCAFIAARKDCADFVIQGVLRLMYWERQTRRLSNEISALMKDTILGFKYWVDEPGDTVMVMGTENHRLLFHVAEWMAGQLFPTEEFTNSQMRGLYHADKGRTLIAEWLRRRGRYGLEEWLSSYYPVTMTPLLNVYDFAYREDSRLREMAGSFLDFMFLNLAQDSFEGILGTAHARCYGVNLKYPDHMATSAMSWLAFGVGPFNAQISGMGPVTMATSDYHPPAILTRMALDNTSVLESRERQDYKRGPLGLQANYVVYRTPDYQISGLQDLHKGEITPSTHVAQVTLSGKVVLFWSCPITSGEGSGMRPDYWSGHLAMPRVIQHRNVLSLTWHLPELAWMTHCWFERAKMDEVRMADAHGGRWALARVGHGYVGIWSEHGFVVGSRGQYAGRELQCYARDNTWLVECGREADWGSFDAFVEAVCDAHIASGDGVTTYRSPSVGEFVTGWHVVPTVKGQPVPTRGHPLVESEWAQAGFASGCIALHYADQAEELHLGE